MIDGKEEGGGRESIEEEEEEEEERGEGGIEGAGVKVEVRREED